MLLIFEATFHMYGFHPDMPKHMHSAVYIYTAARIQISWLRSLELEYVALCHALQTSAK